MCKKIIIGATGYVGNVLFSRSKDIGNALGTSSKINDDGLIHFCLDSPLDFDYSLIESGDVIFLTAAISSPDICKREFDRAWGVNVTGTSEFISKAIKLGARVIFFSSDVVYGECDREFDESYLGSPAGEYAQMKHEVERRFFGNPYFKSIRLSYVFSHEDKFTRYLIESSSKNIVADLFHPFCRAIVHRDDVISGALNLADRWNDIPDQIINFGGPQVLSRIDFAECLREAHLKELRFKVTQPDEAFFYNRPRVIAMTSPILEMLLGRAPRSLLNAASLEFEKNKTIRNNHD